RGHGRPGVAGVERLGMREDVLCHQPGIALDLREIDDPIRDDREVLGGGHGLDAGQGFCFAGIDGSDAGVGMGTAEDLAMQQAWQVHVRPVSRVARDLIQAVMTDGPGPHDRERAWARALCTRCGRHTLSLLDQMSYAESVALFTIVVYR